MLNLGVRAAGGLDERLTLTGGALADELRPAEVRPVEVSLARVFTSLLLASTWLGVAGAARFVTRSTVAVRVVVIRLAATGSVFPPWTLESDGFGWLWVWLAVGGWLGLAWAPIGGAFVLDTDVGFIGIQGRVGLRFGN